ncbi:MAG: hypothetical protein Q8O52_14335 [Sulfuritalea sp.]|nr:hypothetical protein [Sulfuritalea sp.]
MRKLNPFQVVPDIAPSILTSMPAPCELAGLFVGIRFDQALVALLEPFSHGLHDKDGKPGRLIDQKMEPLLVDNGELTICASSNSYRARGAINHGEFSDNGSCGTHFYHDAIQSDLGFTGYQHIHHVAGISLAKQYVAALQWKELRVVAKYVEKKHKALK